MGMLDGHMASRRLESAYGGSVSSESLPTCSGAMVTLKARTEGSWRSRASEESRVGRIVYGRGTMMMLRFPNVAAPSELALYLAVNVLLPGVSPVTKNVALDWTNTFVTAGL